MKRAKAFPQIWYKRAWSLQATANCFFAGGPYRLASRKAHGEASARQGCPRRNIATVKMP